MTYLTKCLAMCSRVSTSLEFSGAVFNSMNWVKQSTAGKNHVSSDILANRPTLCFVRLTSSMCGSGVGNELSCGTSNVCLSLGHDDDRCSIKIYSRNHVLLPIRFVLVVELQNKVRPFPLGDCCVLLLLRFLAEFGHVRTSEPFRAILAEPHASGNMKWYPSIGTKTSFVLLLLKETSDEQFFSDSSESATSRSPFQLLPHVEHYPQRSVGVSPCRIDGAVHDLPLISDDIRLLFQMV